MGLGILYALSACFIWGLIFIVPQYLGGFSSIEVALGRYFFYGLLSFIMFFKARVGGACRYKRNVWIKALSLALYSSVLYYTSLVLSLRYATPAVCALILGISPITIAFYGNWKQKECSYKSLMLPSCLILLGLIFINVPHLKENGNPSHYLFGLIAALVALTSWTYYAVENAQFLKKHPQITSSDWTTLIGVSSFFWAALFALIGIVFGADVRKYFIFTPELINFLEGTMILGFLCAWLGGLLWNRASFHLPVSLVGQMSLFETIFGVLFVYIAARDLPPFLESIGMLILFIAIGIGIRAAFKVNAKKEFVH